jgi:hypothetical protein
MTRDPFVDELERYLDEYEGSTPLPEHVRDAVRARLPSVVRRPAWWPELPPNVVVRAVRVAVASAAVVAVVAVGLSLAGRVNVGGPDPGDPATPRPTASPTPPPPLPAQGALAPGSYSITSQRFTPIRVELTVPAGWIAGDGDIGKHPDQPTELGLGLFRVTHVYADACASEGTLTEIGPMADDLVAALMAQQHTALTGPTEVQLGGYPAERIDIEIPQNLDMATCRHPELIQIWAQEPETDFFAVYVGYSGSVYVADVDGQRVVITTSHGPDATDEDLAELAEIVASMHFSP